MSGHPEPAKRSALWLVTAAWAHPHWDQYLFLLADLDSIENPPPVRYRDDDTHELLVFAINPDKPHASIIQPKLDGFTGLEIQMLQPANHGFHFKSASHDVAVERVQAVVDAVRHKRLSPDTDWRTVWNLIFWDAHSLVRSAFEDANP